MVMLQEPQVFIEDLNEFLERGEDLPTLPDVVFELHRALEDESVGDGQIAKILESDPALTARILRVANSALYNAGAEITSITGAIQRLGLRQVRSVCLVLSVVKCLGARESTLDHGALWEHSAAVGLTAQMLWRKRGVTKVIGADDVYVAGLLHDIGLLVLDQFFNEKMVEILEVQQLSGDPLWRSEDLVLGMDHGEIGGLLLGRWGIPERIQQMVAGHHHPDTVSTEFRDASRAVHVAEMICGSSGMGLTIEGPSDLNVDDAAQSLGMSSANVAAVLGELSDIGDQARAFLAAA